MFILHKEGVFVDYERIGRVTKQLRAVRFLDTLLDLRLNFKGLGVKREQHRLNLAGDRLFMVYKLRHLIL